MPPYCPVRSLVDICNLEVSKLLHTGVVYLDSIWQPNNNTSTSNSASSTPKTSPIGFSLATRGILPPEPVDCDDEKTSVLNEWLRQIPSNLLENVVDTVLQLIEKAVHEDKDCKLILTLINIEKTKPSDFFFGVHSLFRALVDLAITKLPFSTKMWFCIWEYEQIITCDYLQRCFSETIPRLGNIQQINLAYVATDKIIYLLARHCRQLQDLCLDHSYVTDRGIRFMTGWPLGSLANEIGQMLSGVSENTATGCLELRRLSLQGCSSVSDQSLIYLLQHNKHIQVLRYHQSYSVAEILCSQCRKWDPEVTLTNLALQVFDHPFPYGLNLPSDVIGQVATICPAIHTLNIVSNDDCLPAYTQFKGLKRATIELEDAFGLGLLTFLEAIGSQLKELTISCGSDADSTFLEGGGRPYQLFNVGLKLARMFCPELDKLNISGCGLVANELLARLERWPPDDNRHSKLAKLRSLILLTYYDSDDTPVQTCDEKLLLKTLKGCQNLACISLEGNFSSFLNDTFIGNVLAVNPMSKLRIFDVQGTKVQLTINTANRFLALPQLRELRVSTWKLSESELKSMDDTVRRKGWDLRLRKKSSQPN